MTVEIEKKRDLVFGYVRVSTFKQVDGYSIGNQRDKITTQVNRMAEDGLLNRPVLRLYEDKAKSGKDVKNRPEFSRLIAEIDIDDPSHVIVTKLDRWGRNTIDIVKHVELLQQKGIVFIAMDLNIDTSTPVGIMVLTVMSALAQLERDQIRERTSAGIERAREKGVKFGRKKIKLDEKTIIHDLNVAKIGLENTAIKRGVSVGTIKNRLAEWGYDKSYEKITEKEVEHDE